MKIQDLSVRRFRGEGGGDYSAEIQVVDVTTDEGVTGTGYAAAPPGIGRLMASLLREVLAPCVNGHDPRLTGDLWARMHGAIPRRGAGGIMRPCMAAVDFALWDVKGKLAGVPVSTLLGGHRERIASYANCAHHMAPDALAERAASYVANGHRALKIRGSRSYVTLREATARVQAVREAIGPEVRLMVDVNGTWDADTAIGQLRAWEPFDVYWLEEPVPPEDIAGYARVRARAGNTYVAGGEQHVGLAEFRTLIEHGGIDVAQPNAAICGGITEFLRVHAYATAHAVPVSPWNLQSVHLHAAAGLPNVKWIEYFMPDNELLAFQTRLFTGPAMREEVTDEGVFLLPPQAPGIGFDLDPEVAEESRIAE